MGRETEESISQETIEVTGDTLVLAEGIDRIAGAIDRAAEGLNRIADAISSLAKIEQEGFGDPQESNTYLDGSLK